MCQIKEHISTGDHRHIQWLNGLVGMGKNTIVKTVAHLFVDENQLEAPFFCSCNEADQSNVRLIIPTLAFQLSETVLGFATEPKVINAKSDISYTLPSEQLQKLIIGPLQNVGLLSQPILIVIDACSTR